MHKVVLTHHILLEGAQMLEGRFQVIAPGPEKGAFTREELSCHLKDAAAVLAADAVTGEMIENAPGLKIISNYGAGYDRIDVDAATRHGVVVTNIPDVTAAGTAELTMALILSARRRVAELDRKLRTMPSEQVFGMGKNMGHSLRGKVLGIVGMGHIGSMVRDMAEAFSMRVIYHNRRPVLGREGEYRQLSDLLSESDIVTLHCPFTPETRGMIGKAQIDQMKKDALLVNMARGGVVEYDALICALKDRQIAGAALDVFPQEPQVPRELLCLDNVVLTPHIGTNTVEDRREMSEACCMRIADVLGGRRPKNVVNPDVYR